MNIPPPHVPCTALTIVLQRANIYIYTQIYRQFSHKEKKNGEEENGSYSYGVHHPFIGQYRHDQCCCSRSQLL